MQRLALGVHEREDLERGEDAVAGGVMLAEDDVARRLAAELRAGPRHLLPDVAVPHLRATELDPRAPEERFERTVRHHRADHDRRVQLVVSREVARGEREHDVAIMDAAGRVDGDDAIAVAIEGEADVRLLVHHRARQRLWRGRAAALVDVLPVGLIEEREHLGAGAREHGRRDAVRRAVRAVERDTHAGERRRDRPEEGFVLLHQTPGVTDKTDARLRRARHRIGTGHEALDLVLDLVRELLAAVVEELDPVVGRRVVRSADDRAGEELLLRRQVGQPGRRDVTHEAYVDADGAEARGERPLEHPAAPAGVATDDDGVAAAAQGVAGGATKPQGQLGRELLVGDATDAVGAEKAAHRARLWVIFL